MNIYCNTIFFLYAIDVSSSININTAITNDYVIENGGSITIIDDGYINGNISKNPSITNDVVNINTDYNTIKDSYSTEFGSSGNNLSNVNLNNSNLFISNSFYVDNLNINNGSLTLNSSSGINISNITNTTGSSAKIYINENYSANTIFGDTSNAINSITINGTADLTLNNNVYVDNIVLSNDSSSFLNLNSNSNIFGNIISSENGSGTININTNYNNSNTNFGNINNSIGKVNVTNGNSLTLDNIAYINNMELNGSNSSLTLNENSGIIGNVYGGGIINLNRNYNTSNALDLNFYNTNFGINGNSIDFLNVGDDTSGYNLILGNIAYVDNLVLNNSNSILTLDSNSAVVGSIYGAGTLNINTNYSTTNIAGINSNNTNIGLSDSSRIENVNLGQNSDIYNSINEIAVNLDLNNTAYVGTMKISDNSVLNINSSGSVNGIIIGSENNQGIVNINNNYNTGVFETTFGVNGNAIKQVNLLNSELTLTNSAYINNLVITNNSDFLDTKRLFTMEANSSFTGSITLNKKENDMLIGIVLNGDYKMDLLNLLSIINSGTNNSISLTNDNELYLNLINRNNLQDGAVINIASGNDYSNADLIYDGIFMNLQLEKTPTDLNLIVSSNKTPTLNDVSQATITSANIIDNWGFDTKSINENLLTSNLQAISDKKEFFHAITNLTPDISGLNIKIPTQSIISAVDNINKRLNFLRIVKFNENSSVFTQKILEYSPDYYDEYIKKRNLWWEAFGGTLHQDTVNNVFGYDATFYGGTIGYDIKLTPSFVFGGSYTFNNINANDLDYIKNDRDDLKALTNNIDLYMMFYNKWQYLTFNIGGAFNIYEQKRKINFQEFNKIAKADYNGFSYYGAMEYGFNILLHTSNKNFNKSKYNTLEKITNNLEKLSKNKEGNFLMLTPKFSLNYSNIMIDDYTEKGADAGNLVIKTKNYNSLDINGGLSLTYNNLINNITNFQTILNGFVSYSIINDKIELDARYIDDDRVFKVYGIDLPDLTYNFGINFNFNFYSKINIGLGYNYVFGDNFNGQVIKLSILYNF